MKMNENIGIFDSGVGGLTVVRAVNKLLPEESVVYFGDTARVPYGSKSPDTVIRFALENTRFLLTKNIKMLVVACNTASSVSIPALKNFTDIAVTGVIHPGAKAAAEKTRSGIVGVVGTHGTIASGAYQKALKGFPAVKRVIAQPCPLLVPLVEEGWINHRITILILEEYLKPLLDEGIDTLVLGCTHYPLLKECISGIVGDSVKLVDSAEATAEEISRIIANCNITSDAGFGTNSFFVSDIPLKFQEIAQRFLGSSVPLVTQIEVDERT